MNSTPNTTLCLSLAAGFALATLVAAGAGSLTHLVGFIRHGSVESHWAGNSTVADGGRSVSDIPLSSTPPPARAGAGDSVGDSGRGQPGGSGVHISRDSGLSSVETTPASARAGISPVTDRLLDAIRSTESLGSDVSRPNRKGALGPYQFLRSTWDDHARGVPWAQAVDERAARVVATRYLAWLDRTISKWQGQPASLEQVLCGWNGGIGRLRERGFKVENMPAESREFVCRVKKEMENRQ